MGINPSGKQIREDVEMMRKMGLTGEAPPCTENKSHTDNCHAILGALGANHGEKLKELESLVAGDLGVDLDELGTVSELVKQIDPKDAQDIVDWIKKNHLRTQTESK